jgi:hypothetical protein
METCDSDRSDEEEADGDEHHLGNHARATDVIIAVTTAIMPTAAHYRE